MRVKRGLVSKRKHNKLLASTKGYRMTKSRLIKVAKEASLHAGQYAYAGRRIRKSDFRRLWITRISGALKVKGLTYSTFINKLKRANVQLDRKILADLVLNDSESFQAVVDKVGKI